MQQQQKYMSPVHRVLSWVLGDKPEVPTLQLLAFLFSETAKQKTTKQKNNLHNVSSAPLFTGLIWEKIPGLIPFPLQTLLSVLTAF